MDLNEIKQAFRELSPDRQRELLAWMKAEELASRNSWIGKIRRTWHERVASLPGPLPAVIGTLIGLATFAVLEGFIFHSGWYNKYLEPNSTAGQTEYHLFWLERMPPPKAPDVLVVGDSRIAEGFSQPVANAAINGKVHFTGFGISGTSPRVWYYLLRDADLTRTRFSAIVIALDKYSDVETGDIPQNRADDFGYLTGRLRLSDCPDYAHSYLDSNMRREILAECVFRGIAMRPDVQAFLPDIGKRLKYAKDYRNRGQTYMDGYTGMSEDLTGLTLDASTRTIHFPPGVTEVQKRTAQGTLTPYIVAQTDSMTAYRNKWLGGILDLYRNSATRIIFLQLPRAPLPIPDSPEPARFIDSVRGRRRVTILPVDLFHHLQRPEWFADGLHLNRIGRQFFSAELAVAVSQILTSQ